MFVAISDNDGSPNLVNELNYNYCWELLLYTRLKGL